MMFLLLKQQEKWYVFIQNNPNSAKKGICVLKSLAPDDFYFSLSLPAQQKPIDFGFENVFGLFAHTHKNR